MCTFASTLEAFLLYNLPEFHPINQSIGNRFSSFAIHPKFCAFRLEDMSIDNFRSFLGLFGISLLQKNDVYM